MPTYFILPVYLHKLCISEQFPDKNLGFTHKMLRTGDLYSISEHRIVVWLISLLWKPQGYGNHNG